MRYLPSSDWILPSSSLTVSQIIELITLFNTSQYPSFGFKTSSNIPQHNMFTLTSLALLGSFAVTSLAQSSTTTLSLYFGNDPSASSYGWDGSIVGADTTRTTVAVNCRGTCGPLSGQTVRPRSRNPVPSSSIQDLQHHHRCPFRASYQLTYAFQLTLVQGASEFQISYATGLASQTGQVYESCALSSTTYAACVGHASINIAGLNTASTVSTTYTSLAYVPVTITAGVSKLAAVTMASATATSATTAGATAAAGTSAAPASNAVSNNVGTLK